jgi:hypothetical protein
MLPSYDKALIVRIARVIVRIVRVTAQRHLGRTRIC